MNPTDDWPEFRDIIHSLCMAFACFGVAAGALAGSVSDEVITTWGIVAAGTVGACWFGYKFRRATDVEP